MLHLCVSETWPENIQYTECKRDKNIKEKYTLTYIKYQKKEIFQQVWGSDRHPRNCSLF